MSRPRNAVPTYKLHSPTGQAVIRVYTPDGLPRTLYLGPYNSPESRREYARVCAALRPGSVYVEDKYDRDLTLAELAVQYLEHARVYYRDPDGRPTNEIREVRAAVRFLDDQAGELTAADFGPKALAGVRAAMVAAGWCRPLVNKRVDRVKRMIKWAVAEELVPPTTYDGLRALAGLKRGRSEAREPDPVEPVPVADFDRALARLPAMPRAVCEVMRFTGMRPGEACKMTWEEIDRAADVWVYRPTRHKTEHHGRRRAIPLGPRAQAALLAWQGDRPQAGRLFCAAEERERRFERMRAGRKSKVQPSQASRRKAAPKRLPRPGYTPHALAHAVYRACDLAGVPRWHPNRVRHLVLTEVRDRFGLDYAQVIGGHARADVTQVYAAVEERKGAQVAAEVG